MTMASSPQLSLYQRVVNITNEYMGPAADRFVTRQIESHLDKPAEQLKKQDLARLIDWISLAMALLTEDEQVLRKYLKDLNALASNKSG